MSANHPTTGSNPYNGQLSTTLALNVKYARSCQDSMISPSYMPLKYMACNWREGGGGELLAVQWFFSISHLSTFGQYPYFRKIIGLYQGSSQSVEEGWTTPLPKATSLYCDLKERVKSTIYALISKPTPLFFFFSG